MKKIKPNTLIVHGTKKHHTEIQEHVFPIYQTSTYVFKDVKQGASRFAGKESGYIFGRLGNPNYDILAERLAALEEGDTARIYPTGMSAISTVLEGLLNASDHWIWCSRTGPGIKSQR